MTTPSTEQPPRPLPGPGPAGSRPHLTVRGRRADPAVVAFRAVVLLTAVVVLSGPGGAADLSAAVPGAGLANVSDLHRWHHVDIAGYLSVLTLGTLLVAAWSPRRAVVAVQTLLASLAGFALLASTTPTPSQVVVPVVAIVTLVAISHPRRRALLHRTPLQVRGRLSLAAATLLTPFLALNLWQNLWRQLGGTDPHALLGHWAGAAALAFALLLTAWVAATAVPEARALAVVVAATASYLGVAALVHDSHDGAWPIWGAMSAIGAAVLFVASLREPSPRASRSETRSGTPASAAR